MTEDTINKENGSGCEQSYQELIRNPARAKELIEGSFLRADHPIKAWEGGRRFIAHEINHDGSILDIGCSNGLLLKSFQAWSNHTLEPFGIDINRDLIEKAKVLFPTQAGYFSAASLREFLENPPSHLPESFDFIYWSIWDNHNPTANEIEGLLSRIKPGGRLILGSYPNDEEQRKADLAQFEEIRAFGHEVKIINNSVPGRKESVAIIEAPTAASLVGLIGQK